MRFWVRRTPVEVMGVDSIVSSRRRVSEWPGQIQVAHTAGCHANFKRRGSKADSYCDSVSDGGGSWKWDTLPFCVADI